MPPLRRTGHHAEAETLIDMGGEYGALERGGNDGGRREEALEEGGKNAEIGADLLAESGGAEAEGTASDTGFGAADIAADGSETAAWIFDQGSDNHIGADLRGLLRFHKFAITIVDHADNRWLDAPDKGNQFSDLRNREGGACLISLGALNGDQPCVFADGGADSVIVEGSVGEKIDLAVADAILAERTGGGADADDFFQCIIGASDRGEELIAREKIGRERNGERMGAAGDLGTHERSFGAKAGRIDLFQHLAPHIVIAVSGGGSKASGIDAVFLHGVNDLGLIEFGYAIHLFKALA